MCCLVQKPWTLQVKGPNSSSYTDTTAANIEADLCCNATVKLTSSPFLKMEPTVRGYAFNTSYVIVASDQVSLLDSSAGCSVSSCVVIDIHASPCSVHAWEQVDE